MAPSDGRAEPADKGNDKEKTSSITIDGEEYDVSHGDNLVGDLIRLTGADPVNTDLVEVKGRQQTTLRDDDHVSVNSGSKFVTISTEPTPVA